MSSGPAADNLARACKDFMARLEEHYGVHAVMISARFKDEDGCYCGWQGWSGDGFAVYGMARKLVEEQETCFRESMKNSIHKDDE